MAWNEPGGGNQHDPWSGGGRRGGNGSGDGGKGGGNQGPPDLDEALKKFQNKLNNMLGGRGKRGGNGGGSGGGKPRNTFALPGLLLIVALAIWAASGFYLVDESERGVVLRFGKYQETVTPGLQWNPPLIDDVRMVNVTRVRSISQTQSMLTQDENIVSVEISAQYQVADPRDYVLNVRNPELSLENALDSALRHVVGGTDMIEILTSGRAILGSSVSSRLQSYLDSYGTGITLQTLNVESTSPPDAVQDAFDDVIRAREDRQRTINQAMAYANAVIPEAQGKAQRLIEQGQGYRESVVAEAQGQANRFNALLTQYEQSPDIMRERLYLETLSEVYSGTSKVMVDVAEQSPLMVLPMDKLNSRTSSSASGQSSDSQLDPQVLQRLQNSESSSSTGRSGNNNGALREGR
ncbi:FtsH protease activity modulator HflK [Halomonas sp. 18H]|uniref:FtsH protease activity modulator HflK n=1 Tax=Halomonas almeriensis TaxID=308163 RepID=UPI0022320947|nr:MULTISPECIES: FtsH protease activity modulator HflK [Halomonas]MCW4149340.1 FtsH protease activity modulator HflK [Halomonas sp. 18H]MDN3553714.1 FtsH protease activity modulator HflK [Halomonas almeriensis]